ncbi:ion transporter [Noviherbaspirillum massiliense]|uniref:ion transporter n=1 Tax=Noviherbaspirillum massiliense TaxID=1465823 RepID=UPI0002D30CF7|nr:ion transporter [Noviherbaspirillum massiliense]
MDQTQPIAVPSTEEFGKPEGGLRRRVYSIIFESDTKAGKRFDLTLIAVILFSILVVMMDSVHAIGDRYGTAIDVLEWGFTILFTIEYLARIYCVKHPLRYMTSVFGIIDLLAILPTYLALVVPEVHALLDVRILRLLRIFRILKLTLYVAEYQALMAALRASQRKIFVFILFVMMVVLILGTVMYVVEGPEHGFTSIPKSVYWAIVTLTTVGYGDITPQTNTGKMIASLMMMLGWGTLAVPTGIVTAEMAYRRMGRQPSMRVCAACRSEGHEADAKFCKDCGAALSKEQR